MANKSKLDQFKIISLRHLCSLSETEYFKLYNNLKGSYDTLDANEKTTLANTLFEALKPVFQYMGFQITMKRLPSSDK